MKGLTLEIRPLEGFGALEFGSKPEDAVKFLGEPSEEEVLEDDEDLMDTLIQHFDESGITIYYDDLEDPVLTNFETDNPDVTLFGSKVFEMTEEQIIGIMKENGYEEFDIDEVDSDDEEDDADKWLSFDDALIDFLFQDGKVVNVNWGAYFEDEDMEDEDSD
jgi:hypothetical protein